MRAPRCARCARAETCLRPRAASRKPSRRHARAAGPAWLIEMQAGGRRRHCARLARVDGLVARLVFVARPPRRCMAAAAPRRARSSTSNTSSRPRNSKTIQIVLALQHAHLHARRVRSARVPARGAWLARTSASTCAVIEHPLDQHLDPAAAVLVAEQPRLDHARVVEHQHVGGREQPGRSAKRRSASAPVLAVERQQAALARRCAGGCWAISSAGRSKSNSSSCMAAHYSWCRERDSNPHSVTTGGF